MLSFLTYFGYTMIGFGVGGIVFKGIDSKEILSEFNIFKKEKTNEIEQMNKKKDTNLVQVQVLTKSIAELRKLYNRSKRTVELNEIEIESIKEALTKKTVKTEKDTFDDFLNAKN